MKLRAATRADTEPLAALAAVIPGAPHWPLQAYGDFVTKPGRVLLLAEDSSQQLCGYAAAVLIAPAPFEAELETIAVRPVQQRRGCGLLLLRAIQHWAAAQQATALHLEVRSSNQAALALYRASGFRVTGRRRAYYSAPAEDAVLMQWTPPASSAGNAGTSGKIDGDYGS